MVCGKVVRLTSGLGLGAVGRRQAREQQKRSAPQGLGGVRMGWGHSTAPETYIASHREKPSGLRCVWRRGWGEEGLRLKEAQGEVPYDPAIPLLGTYPEMTKQECKKAQAPPCSQRHYLQ